MGGVQGFIHIPLAVAVKVGHGDGLTAHHNIAPIGDRHIHSGLCRIGRHSHLTGKAADITFSVAAIIIGVLSQIAVGFTALIADRLFGAGGCSAGVLGAVYRSHRQHITGVILVVNGAVSIADGTANAILLIAGSIVNFHQFQCFLGCCLGGIHLNQAQAAGLVVVGAVEIQLALIGIIRRTEQHGALGITLQSHIAAHLQGGGVGHHKIPLGAGGTNAAAGGKIHLITVHDRRGSGLGIVIDHLQIAQRAGNAVYRGRAEIAALGSEVHAAHFLTVCHGGALIAGTGQLQCADFRAGFLVQGIHMRVACRAACAVIRTENHGITDHYRTGPIEAAGHRLCPLGGFRFVCLCSIFVLYRKADIVGLLLFTVPKAGIDAAVRIGNRAQ